MGEVDFVGSVAERALAALEREGCRLSYEPERGLLTGLIRLPATPWDQPDTWWLDVLATWPIDPPNPFLMGLKPYDDWPDKRRSRTDALLLPVRIEDDTTDVLQEAARILGSMGAVEAIVCHQRAPMDKETTMSIEELNAKLTKWCRVNKDPWNRMVQVEREGQRIKGVVAQSR